MAKKRKTRDQKKLADLRHSFTHTMVNQVTPFEAKIRLQPQATIVSSPKSEAIKTTNAYPFLVKDLSKTGGLTLAILAFQIILFFLLTNHLFKIPGLTY